MKEENTSERELWYYIRGCVNARAPTRDAPNPTLSLLLFVFLFVLFLLSYLWFNLGNEIRSVGATLFKQNALLWMYG